MICNALLIGFDKSGGSLATNIFVVYDIHPVHTYTHMHTYICVYIHTYIRTYVHTCIYCMLYLISYLHHVSH